MSSYRVDTGVPFLRDDVGRIAGYIDDLGAERDLDGKPLSGGPPFTMNMVRGALVAGRVLVLGASTVVRTMVQRSWNGADYSRNAAGIVTVKVLQGGGSSARWFVGHWVQICSSAADNMDFLGPILSAAVDGNGDTTITYQDIAGDPLAAGPAAGGDCHDMAASPVMSNWLAAFHIATEGACDVEVLGCGGTNALHWTGRRLKRIADRAAAVGGYDAIFICLSGNLVNAAALGGKSAYSELDRLLSQVCPLGRRVFLEPPDGGRGAVNSTQTFTAAMRLMRMMYTEFARKYPNLGLAQTAEILGNNWSPYNVTTPLDVKRCWAPATWMNPGNAPMVHYSWPAASRVGVARAQAIIKDLQAWSPELGSFPDNSYTTTTLDNDGGAIPNVWVGFFGQVANKAADSPATGKQPQGTTFTVANAGGGMAAVMSLPANAEGGSDWLTVLTDTSGSVAGATLTWSLTGVGSNTILAALNLAANQGKRIRMIVPVEVGWDNEFTVTSVEVGLFCTVGGVEFPLCNPMLNDGLFNMPGTGANKLGLFDTTVQAGGTGYVVGDRLTVSGGTQTSQAKFVVTKVNAGAVVDGVFADFGNYTVVPSNPASTTGGTGTGCTLNCASGNIARNMDWGFCGPLRDPSPWCMSPPVGTVATAADLRLKVLGGGNSSPMGELRVRIGREARIEFLDW